MKAPTETSVIHLEARGFFQTGNGIIWPALDGRFFHKSQTCETSAPFNAKILKHFIRSQGVASLLFLKSSLWDLFVVFRAAPLDLIAFDKHFAWRHVSCDGEVKGLHMDGNKIRDRILAVLECFGPPILSFWKLHFFLVGSVVGLFKDVCADGCCFGISGSCSSGV